MTVQRNTSNTPEGVHIKPRNLEFDLAKSLAIDWVGGDPFMTAIYNAMSIGFPAGEKNFIDNIRAYEDRITDKKLLEEIHGFYQQEGVHSREHKKYNKILCEQRGYDLQDLESVTLARIEKSHSDPRATPRVMLAATVALEHFTASFGQNVLEGRLLKNADEPVRKLWLWHSMEELEHKSVALDVYNEIGGSYKMRTRMIRLSTWFFFKDTLRVAAKMLRHDKKLYKWQTLKSLYSFIFAKQGFIRLHAAEFKDFFREDFHPWDVDNRALLQRWEKILS